MRKRGGGRGAVQRGTRLSLRGEAAVVRRKSAEHAFRMRGGVRLRERIGPPVRHVSSAGHRGVGRACVSTRRRSVMRHDSYVTACRCGRVQARRPAAPPPAPPPRKDTRPSQAPRPAGERTDKDCGATLARATSQPSLAERADTCVHTLKTRDSRHIAPCHIQRKRHIGGAPMTGQKTRAVACKKLKSSSESRFLGHADGPSGGLGEGIHGVRVLLATVECSRPSTLQRYHIQG